MDMTKKFLLKYIKEGKNTPHWNLNVHLRKLSWNLNYRYLAQIYLTYHKRKYCDILRYWFIVPPVVDSVFHFIVKCIDTFDRYCIMGWAIEIMSLPEDTVQVILVFWADVRNCMNLRQSLPRVHRVLFCSLWFAVISKRFTGNFQWSLGNKPIDS